MDDRSRADEFFFFSSRRRHTRLQGDWSSDVCSSDLLVRLRAAKPQAPIMSRKRNSPNARPAPDFQSSAYDIGRPLTVHSTIGSTRNTSKTGPATMAPWQSISNGKGRALAFLHHLFTIARASVSR